MPCVAAHGATELPPGRRCARRKFWRTLHAVLVSAETLGVARDLVEDRLLGETKESSTSGRYAMALLRELARPSRCRALQFAAVTPGSPAGGNRHASLSNRITARSRSVLHSISRSTSRFTTISVPPNAAGSRSVSAAQDQPEDPKRWPPANCRNSSASARRFLQVCSDLLADLARHLEIAAIAADSSGGCADRSRGLRFREPVRRDRWHRLRDASLHPSSFGNQLSQAQLAVFGHVVQHEEKVGRTEYWRVTQRERNDLACYDRQTPGNAPGAEKPDRHSAGSWRAFHAR